MLKHINDKDERGPTQMLEPGPQLPCYATASGTVQHRLFNIPYT